MKQISEIITLAESLNTAIKNPCLLAELYANLGSDEQAVFWDAVAFEFRQFGGAKGCGQNCMIAEALTDQAKEHIKNLHRHIELDEEESPELSRLKAKAARVDKALEELRDMIDGGEECRGMDSQISSVIRILVGETI